MKRRLRKISYLMVIVMVVIGMTCVASAGTEKEKAVESGDTKVEALKPMEWRMCACTNPADPMTIYGVNWAKAVERMTEGKIKITMFDSMKLGDERETVEQMQAHALEAGMLSNGTLANFVKTQAIYNLPYLFMDLDQCVAFEKTDEAAMLRAKFEDADIKVLGFHPAMFRHIMNAERLIREPADLKGLKIRVMENPIHIASMNAMGASAVPMSWSEVYTSLQTGVLDGFENSMSGFTTTKIYEILKYLSFTNHFYDVAFCIMDLQVYNSLDPEIQEILHKAADEALETDIQILLKEEEKGLELLKSEGVKVNYPDLAPFIERVQPVYEKFYKDFPELKPIVNKIKELKT
jgi:tripartite ATP-independent transporter DctP family solute receptor